MGVRSTPTHRVTNNTAVSQPVLTRMGMMNLVAGAHDDFPLEPQHVATIAARPGLAVTPL